MEKKGGGVTILTWPVVFFFTRCNELVSLSPASGKIYYGTLTVPHHGEGGGGAGGAGLYDRIEYRQKSSFMHG